MYGYGRFHSPIAVPVALHSTLQRLHYRVNISPTRCPWLNMGVTFISGGRKGLVDAYMHAYYMHAYVHAYVHAYMYAYIRVCVCMHCMHMGMPMGMPMETSHHVIATTWLNSHNGLHRTEMQGRTCSLLLATEGMFSCQT